MTDSPHQLAIYSAIQSSTRNLFVDAKAGAGKTTTILRSLSFLPARRPGELAQQSIRFLAFNKSIADTLKSRVPKHVFCSTFHSLGLSALKQLPRFANAAASAGRDWIDGRKVHKLVWNSLDRDHPDSQHIIKLVGLAKNLGYSLPVPHPTLSEIVDLFNIDFAEPVSSIKVTETILGRSTNDISKIDFDDMLYLALFFNAPFSPLDYIFVDEAQDLNSIQLEVLRRSFHGYGQTTPTDSCTRLIAVGDPAQAIYGFRGAGRDAISDLKSTFNCLTLPLSVCYRCATSIITEAQKIVPSITAWDQAPSGEVLHLTHYHSTDFTANSAILCRNIAPLVGHAYALLQRDIPCTILGRDIGAQLIGLVRRMRATNLTDLKTKLTSWCIREVEDHMRDGKSPERIQDQFDCLVFFIKSLDESSQTVPDLIAKIELMFSESSDSSRITLCSIHKAKGLEWPTVYLLDRNLLPSKYAQLPWQLEQEQNLLYVATTRAMKRLVYISSNNWAENNTEK